MKLKLDYKGCHEGLWNWLAKNPDKRKDDWPGWVTMCKLGLYRSLSNCFACDYVSHSCNNGFTCPVYFGKKNCMEHNSYYRKYQEGINKSHYAQLIANGWK